MSSGVRRLPNPIGFTGIVTTPDDPGYDAVRHTKLHLGSPAAVLAPRTAADIAAAIALARDNGVPLSVRSGGHSAAGHSTNDGGVVIDLSLMNDVRVTDRDTGLVTLGAGALWGNVATALAEHGLAVSAGDTRSVGVGGLVLGGGIGWMVRKHGLTIDNLRAATIVTADGRERRVSADQDPDLLWAVRGGVGNVGVVRSFEIAATPARYIHHAEIHYPGERLVELIRSWAAAMAAAPRELTATAFRLPPGFGPAGGQFVVVAAYSDDDESAATAAFDPLTKLGEPISSAVRRMPYHELLEDPPPAPPGAAPQVRNRFVPRWTDAIAQTIADHLTEAGAVALQLRSVGGAVNDVPVDATAYAHRDAESLVVGVAFDPAGGQVMDAMWETLAPHTSGAYSGFLTDPTGDDLRAAYPQETYARLAVIKAAYDPENIFARTPNVIGT